MTSSSKMEKCVCVYLSSAESDHQISNESVLCLSWAMADHHTPTIRLSQFTPETQRDRFISKFTGFSLLTMLITVTDQLWRFDRVLNETSHQFASLQGVSYNKTCV